jgi:hypothetical protein
MTKGVVFVTGSHPRHAAVARRIAATGHLAGLVIEERAPHVPEPPDDLAADLAELFRHHFRMREAAEHRFFGAAARFPQDVPTHCVTAESLNAEATRGFIGRIDPALMLSYGCHKISLETREAASGLRWNIHGGLSPWYRGVATHFWPSYLLEPQMTGMTVHELTDELDGGAIVHQSTGELVRGDGLHDLACRTVAGLVAGLPELIERATVTGDLRAAVPQRNPGRLWRAVDWAPAHLRPIYELFNDRIVDRYLDGALTGVVPSLVRQF